MADAITSEREPTPQQLAYRLYCGRRYELKVGDATRVATVIDVHTDWLETEFEEDGKPVVPRKFIGVKTNTFRSVINRELESLSVKEAEDRGYR